MAKVPNPYIDLSPIGNSRTVREKERQKESEKERKERISKAQLEIEKKMIFLFPCSVSLSFIAHDS